MGQRKECKPPQQEQYCCKQCNGNPRFTNIVNYYRHNKQVHFSDWDDYHMTTAVLEFMMSDNIEPCQEVFDDMCDDSDMLLGIIKMGMDDIEWIALEILNRMDVDNVCCTHELDDEDELRDYLLCKGVLRNIGDDLSEAMSRYSYNEWEEFCHHTNKSILMHCIKKRWVPFCLRLLDFPALANVNKQNRTNAYEMALKYGLTEVAAKIRKIQCGRL